MNIMPLDFTALALDCKAALGLATPVNPTAEHTTININAGVAIDPNPWDWRLGGVWLFVIAL
jgi:hypothetical protein